jgi:hypothetical protein
MKNIRKLTLSQETLRNMNGFTPDDLLVTGFPCHTQASICNICIPPTESPNCNPA